MLLSAYAAYQWARISKEAYALRMAVFIISISFLSAYFHFPMGSLLLLPLPLIISPVLSFPFYAYYEKIWFGNAAERYWVSFFRIRFLTIDTMSTPSGWQLEQLAPVFSFFLLINFVGAILGYEINRIRRIRGLGNSKRWNLLGAILGSVFMGAGLGFGSFSKLDGAALFLFGIIVFAIIFGRSLRLRIQRTE